MGGVQRVANACIELRMYQFACGRRIGRRMALLSCLFRLRLIFSFILSACVIGQEQIDRCIILCLELFVRLCFEVIVTRSLLGGILDRTSSNDKMLNHV